MANKTIIQVQNHENVTIDHDECLFTADPGIKINVEANFDEEIDPEVEKILDGCIQDFRAN